MLVSGAVLYRRPILVTGREGELNYVAGDLCYLIMKGAGFHPFPLLTQQWQEKPPFV